MIGLHYVKTIHRYVDELARKTALIVHTGATLPLLREVAALSKTVNNLAEVSLQEGQGNECRRQAATDARLDRPARSLLRKPASVVSYKREARTLRIWGDGNRQQPITCEAFSP
ncbi:MAG: hypothetical protein ACREXU_00675 [Gammaproteobacteria bacterium]